MGLFGKKAAERKPKKKSVLFAKRVGVKTINDGLPGVDADKELLILLMDDYLLFQAGNIASMGIPEIKLPFSQIISFGTLNEEALKDKSVIGRAAVGGILLGPLGAVVGAVSGTGKKKELITYLLINYRSSEGKEEALTFILHTPSSPDALLFFSGLKKHARCFNDPDPTLSGKTITL